MQYPHNLLNRYFWAATIGFWMAIHALFTQFQYSAVAGADVETSWWRLYVLLSPWFLNWIWMTASIFVVTRNNDDKLKPLSNKILSHLLWMIVLLFLYWGVSVILRGILEGPSSYAFWNNFVRVVSTSAQIDIFIYGAILSASLGMRFYHNAMLEKVEIRRLNSELVKEQLKTLRSQLNPHFLFNALNTIASLVRLQRDKEAVTALSELSQMLRKILDNKSSADIKIKDEIAFINSYLAIQKMRFTDKLDTRVNVEDNCLEIEIPNMLLHPLVENAVQHGSQLESNKNILNLEITRTDHELKVKLTNKVARNDQHSGFGIGLSHTRERLARIYNHFQLELHPVNDDMFETLLAIPIGEQDA